MDLASQVIDMCRGMGFALAGVTEARPSDHEHELRAWIAAGKNGEMSWLARHIEERLDPGRILPGARSMILVADAYASGTASHVGSDAHAPAFMGCIARYARGQDYHEVVKKRLHLLCDALRDRFPEAGFRSFVDTAPVLEREHAARAGLGWIGKHTLLISPDVGSWFLLGGVLTTLGLEQPEDQRRMPDHCGTCTRCIDACPTGAITPYSVDGARCISYLTIEHRSAIDAGLHEAMGSWLFGCDICQEVCPHNRPRPAAAYQASANPAYAARRASFDVMQVLGWNEEDRRRELSGSAMKRAKLDMWKRNALIVAGNAARAERDPARRASLRHRIEHIAADVAEPVMVRQTAHAVLSKLP